MNDLKNDARELLERAKEKISPVVEDVKEKAMPVIEDAKEKAAPVIAKAKDAASEAVDAVMDAAGKIGELFDDKIPVPHVDNELFGKLETEARAAKDAAMDKAAEMQRRLEELMGKKD